jgi:transcriptional regulator with XRE-family HTH domain
MTAWKRRGAKERQKLVKVLSRWRLIRGKTQEDMCRDVGSAQAQLSRIESGTAGVSVGLLLDMAGALKCDLMVVPHELKATISRMVERYAQECELDLGPRGALGRPRGTLNKPGMSAGANAGEGASAGL